MPPSWMSETKEVSQLPLRMTETEEVSQSPLCQTKDVRQSPLRMSEAKEVSQSPGWYQVRSRCPPSPRRREGRESTAFWLVVFEVSVALALPAGCMVAILVQIFP
jgi:hypothetical protein